MYPLKTMNSVGYLANVLVGDGQMLEVVALWISILAGSIAIGHLIRKGWLRWLGHRRSFYAVNLSASGHEGVYDFADKGWVHIRNAGVNVKNGGRTVYDVVVLVSWDGDTERGSVDLIGTDVSEYFRFDFPREGRRDLEHDKVPPPYVVAYFTDNKDRRLKVRSGTDQGKPLRARGSKMPEQGDVKPQPK